jgi:MATE family multidrug resistance protein
MLLPRELRPLLTLAGPVILAEIGWMAMGVVDTVMVAPLGPAAIGAAGIGSSVFTAIVIFGMGLMLGLDALVSQAHGARNPAEALRWLHHGMFLACLIAPVLGGLVLLVAFTMRAWDLHPDIHALAQPYLRISVAGALRSSSTRASGGTCRASTSSARSCMPSYRRISSTPAPTGC